MGIDTFRWLSTAVDTSQSRPSVVKAAPFACPIGHLDLGENVEPLVLDGCGDERGVDTRGKSNGSNERQSIYVWVFTFCDGSFRVRTAHTRVRPTLTAGIASAGQGVTARCDDNAGRRKDKVTKMDPETTPTIVVAIPEGQPGSLDKATKVIGCKLNPRSGLQYLALELTFGGATTTRSKHLQKVSAADLPVSPATCLQSASVTAITKCKLHETGLPRVTARKIKVTDGFECDTRIIPKRVLPSVWGECVVISAFSA